MTASRHEQRRQWVCMELSPVLHHMRSVRLGAYAHALWRPAGTALLLLLALAAPAGAQVGFDRPGGDYSSFAVRVGDPAICASRCDRDPRCRAWSFSYPTGTVSTAMCWLKGQVPPWRPNPCCVSGV